MNKVINILFVGGAKRYSFAKHLINAGNKLKYSVNIYSYEMGSCLPIESIAKVIQGKKFEHDSVLQDLENIIHKYSIQIAIPFHDNAISLMYKISDVVFTPVSDIDLIDIFSSKKKSVNFFMENNIPFPSFSKKTPAIAKPDKGSASKGIIRFTNQSDLNIFLNSEQSLNYETQDYISGPEYSVDCYVALNSTFKYFAVRERLEVLGGEVVKSRTVDIPEIEEICYRILNISGMRGAITIQLIYDKYNDSYCVMEINPRYGGGILTSWGAGVPWFEILLNDFLHKKQGNFKHNKNICMVRSFREHFSKI
jgi:carbamoyl-phosphate synthase large subunit